MSARKRVEELESKLGGTVSRPIILPCPVEHMTPEAWERVNRGELPFPEQDFTGNEEGWLKHAKELGYVK